MSFHGLSVGVNGPVFEAAVTDWNKDGKLDLLVDEDYPVSFPHKFRTATSRD